MERKEVSLNEERIKKITSLYYSRPDVQKAIFEFSKNREISPRYFNGFGKRPDSFQYTGDIFELVKKGATSFHCSEELWEAPLQISANMNRKEYDKSRIGWDLLIDIDSKYIDYSRIFAMIIIELLKFHGLKNVGIKFSGSKGFHLLVPWKSFPKEINGVKSSDMFPEWPRIVTKYVTNMTKKKLIDEITKMSSSSRYVKDFQVPDEVMPDLILVSSRHLFRMPYSLHEKTALASVVLNQEELKNFHMKDADPLKAKVRGFMPEVKEGEASELLMQALDWHREISADANFSYREHGESGITDKTSDFKPVKIADLSEKHFPPSIKKILQGVEDGKKRSLFILINFFRSVGMEKDELEKMIYEWNKKNNPQLKDSYIKSQLLWSYRNKIVLPPNYDKDYYKGIGITPTEEELRYKNPVTYAIKNLKSNNNQLR